MHRLLNRSVRRTLAKAPRGMTLLEIMIVLAILALVMGLVVGPRVLRMFGKSKNDIAALTAKKFAYEAFGEWAPLHQNQQCPKSLDELTEYMDSKDVKDPWGTPYAMKCGPNLPPGVKGGMAVQSAGEDQKFDTADDIKSWDE